MEVTISNLQQKMKITDQLENTVTAVLQKAAEIHALASQTEVSVVLADDPYIRELNRDYRGKDQATDVLSFALNEGDEPDIIDGPEELLLGDIIISLETAERQAGDFGHTLERELAYLAVHGMLHLLGFDHEDELERQTMRLEEEKVLVALNITRSPNDV